jgi:hypothetical protein
VRYDRRMMPKGRLGQITVGGIEFEVYTTGDPQWLLFCPMQPQGKGNNVSFASSCIQIPIRRSDLKPGWWRRLH